MPLAPSDGKDGAYTVGCGVGRGVHGAARTTSNTNHIFVVCNGKDVVYTVVCGLWCTGCCR